MSTTPFQNLTVRRRSALFLTVVGNSGSQTWNHLVGLVLVVLRERDTKLPENDAFLPLLQYQYIKERFIEN